MSDFASIQSFKDEELYCKLKEHGVDIPVSGSTRRVLERRLAKLLGIPTESKSSSSFEHLGQDEELYDDPEVLLDDSAADWSANQGSPDVVRRRGRQGHDTFGNSFFIEEVDSRPSDMLRARRASEIEHIAEELKTQDELNRNLAQLDKEGSRAARTALTILAVLVVIGVFLVISYMTQGESADELMRVPTPKVVPAQNVIPAGDI